MSTRDWISQLVFAAAFLGVGIITLMYPNALPWRWVSYTVGSMFTLGGILLTIFSTLVWKSKKHTTEATSLPYIVRSNEEIRFAWVCRNIHYDKIERVELTDKMLLTGSYPSWITSDNCEVLAKILPTGKWDKNGKEIWEGDTIIWQDWEQELTEKPDVGVIKYEPPSFIWQWYRKGKALRQDGFENEIHNTDQYEIIGDIWQNPELLKENI